MNNYAIVHLRTEKGCDPAKGEYSLFLVSSLNPLIIGYHEAGTGDVSLIEECIDEAIDSESYALPEDGLTEIRLKETGERQDVFWVKFYEVEEWIVIMVNEVEGEP